MEVHFQTALEKLAISYAYHKIILNSGGQPYDYEFLEVNSTFANMLGMPSKDIIGRKVSELQPELTQGGFDWIAFYGRIALEGTGQALVIREYSQPLKRWFKVTAYSPKKYYFVTLVEDVSEEILRLTNRDQENYKLEKLAEICGQFLQARPEEVNYQGITDAFIEIAEAHYAAFNLYRPDGKTFVTMAMSGIREGVNRGIEVLGFNPIGKVWDHNPRRAELICGQTITAFESLYQLSRNVIPKALCELIERLFNLGTIHIVKILSQGKILGDFTFFMAKGEEFTSYKEVEIFTKNLGIMLARHRAEVELVAREEKYRQLFEETPISLWEEDFSLVKEALDQIKHYINGDIRQYFHSKPDLVRKLAELVRVINVNEATLKMYRADTKEDFFQGITRVFSKASYEHFIPVLEVMLKGEGSYYIEKNHVTIDGKPLEIALYWSVAKGHEENYSRVLVSVVDITEAKAAERKLREQNELLNTIMDNASLAIWLMDLDNNPILINKFFVENTGFGTEGFSVKAKELDHCRRTDFEVLAKELPQQFEERLTFLNGQQHTLQTIKTKLYKNDGTILGILGLGVDVTESKKNEKRLRYLSFHDSLTGLYNRAFFEEEMSRLSKSRDYPITIMSLDLDGLKIINDTLGHQQGDQLLINCAQVLKKSVRESDILARVGGDEFAIILPKTNYYLRESIKKRIIDNINLYNSGEKYLPISVSIGVATANKKEDSLQQIFKIADDRMYHEKLLHNRERRSLIIEAIIASLPAKDYDRDSQERLQRFSQGLGQYINLTTSELENLEMLVRVHDLGNIAIPDDILFKQGPLNVEEWQIVRQHPEKGYRIALNCPQMATIADLLLKHHERWDGKGYPLGLGGAEIPIECRIFAIADAFEAMTSPRPYREAKTREEAIRELKRGAGKQFDPQLVKYFLEVLADLTLSNDS